MYLTGLPAGGVDRSWTLDLTTSFGTLVESIASENRAIHLEGSRITNMQSGNGRLGQLRPVNREQ